MTQLTFEPIVNHNELFVVNPTGTIAICVCWSPKDAWKTIIPQTFYDGCKDDIAVIGNLYTTGGIDNMLRNLLANPQVVTLVVTGTDKDGKLRRAVLAAIENGWALNTIDGEKYIRLDHIDLFLKRVGLKPLEGLDDNILYLAWMRNILDGKRTILLPPTINYDQFQNHVLDVMGHCIHAATLQEAYDAEVGFIREHGLLLQSRYGSMREILGLQITIDSIGDITGVMDQEKASEYANSLFGSMDSGTTYNYGERLERPPGVDSVIDRATGRHAYWPIFVPEDFDNKEPPCLVAAWFRNRDGCHLDGIWSVRSQDMGGGWPYNAYAWYKYQEYLASLHGLQMGQFATFTMSAHLYERDWGYQPLNKQLHDPLGDWVITAEKDKIHASLIKDGQTVFGAYGRSAYSVQKKISYLVRSVDHAMYLGRELQKAEYRLKQGR